MEKRDRLRDIVNLETCSTNLHSIAISGDRKTLKRVLKHSSSEAIEKKDPFGRSPLLCSAASDNLTALSVLLTAGACVDSTNDAGQTALHLAIKKGSYHCVKLLLSNGAVWYQKDRNGLTALHSAASAASVKCLLAILSKLKPGEIDVQDAFKKTALHWSAAHGHIEHVNVLLKEGANVCIPDNAGRTPLHWAALSSNSNCLECLKIIIEKVPSVVNWQDYEGRSALHFAVLNGSIQMVEFLTSQENCNMQILDNQFSTPMHYAAREGFFDKLGLLLDRGADYKTGDANGATAIHYAVYSNNIDAVKVFLSRAYVEDVPDIFGRNALMWASAQKRNDIIEIMSTYNVDLSCEDKAGLTALHIAASQSHLTTVKLLLSLGAPVDVTDKSGLTPLLVACDTGNIEVIKVLLAHGASLLTTDLNKQNCLHRAAKAGIAYLTQMLFQLKPELDTKDDFGKMPLHYASENGSLNCISVFLESCSKPNITDNQGRTPLHYAALNNHYNVVKLLLLYGAFINPVAVHIRKRVTPLDCALHGENYALFRFLRTAGGLTSSEIRVLAAKTIQTWFRRILYEKEKNLLNKGVCYEYHIHCHSHHGRRRNVINCSRSIAHRQICDLKDFHNSDPCVYHQSSSKSVTTNSLKQNTVSRCDLLSEVKVDVYTSGSIVSATYSGSQNATNIPTNTSKNLAKEQAAVILQKTWRRFLLKKKMNSMKQDIAAAFTSISHRKIVEKNWKEKLENFLSTL